MNPKLKKGKMYAFFYKEDSPSFGRYIGNTPNGRVFWGSSFTLDCGRLSGLIPDFVLERGFLLEMPDSKNEGGPYENECIEHIEKVLPE